MKSKAIVSLYIIGFVITLGVVSTDWARAQEKSKAPTLKELMGQLYADLQEVNLGMFYGDLKKVAVAAKRIADHPLIRPDQRMKIAKALGPKMGKFKSYDTNVHDAGVAIAMAANEENLPGVIENYNTMIDNCMQCHIQFRDKINEILK